MACELLVVPDGCAVADRRAGFGWGCEAAAEAVAVSACSGQGYGVPGHGHRDLRLSMWRLVAMIKQRRSRPQCRGELFSKF